MHFQVSSISYRALETYPYNFLYKMLPLIFQVFCIYSTGMSDVKNIRIAKNKIDRIEDFSFPSQNMIGNITLEGNNNFSNQLYMFNTDYFILQFLY